MSKRLIATALCLASTASAGKVTLTAAAAVTTIGINVLEAPATLKKAKAALKRTGNATKKAVKRMAAR